MSPQASAAVNLDGSGSLCVPSRSSEGHGKVGTLSMLSLERHVDSLTLGGKCQVRPVGREGSIWHHGGGE